MAAIFPTSVASANAHAADEIPNPSVAAQTNKSAATQPEATLKPDPVKLSLAAQILSLHHQGVPTSVIASRLGISVKQVSVYIPGSTPAASSTQAPPQAAPTSDSEVSDTDGDGSHAAVKPEAPAQAPAPSPSAPSPSAPTKSPQSTASALE